MLERMDARGYVADDQQLLAGCRVPPRRIIVQAAVASILKIPDQLAAFFCVIHHRGVLNS